MKHLQTTTLRGVAAAAMLICLPALAGADGHALKATAEIKGCTDPKVSRK